MKHWPSFRTVANSETRSLSKGFVYEGSLKLRFIIDNPKFTMTLHTAIYHCHKNYLASNDQSKFRVPSVYQCAVWCHSGVNLCHTTAICLAKIHPTLPEQFVCRQGTFIKFIFVTWVMVEVPPYCDLASLCSRWCLGPQRSPTLAWGGHIRVASYSQGRVGLSCNLLIIPVPILLKTLPGI